MRRLVIKGATKADKIRLEFESEDRATTPMTFRGNGDWHVVFPKGRIRVVRTAGDSLITVLSYQEDLA
jgi:hypothetical protein